MNKILGKKQRIKNEDWIKAVNEIENLVTKQELDATIEKTVADIKEKTDGKNAAFAWSAGKDSLVLEKICGMAGIKACVLVVCNLEYKAFVQWVETHKPPELSIINTGQDMKWLASHQQMLFPQNSNLAAQWFHIVQHRGRRNITKTIN